MAAMQAMVAEGSFPVLPWFVATVICQGDLKILHSQIGTWIVVGPRNRPIQSDRTPSPGNLERCRGPVPWVPYPTDLFTKKALVLSLESNTRE